MAEVHPGALATGTYRKEEELLPLCLSAPMYQRDFQLTNFNVTHNWTKITGTLLEVLWHFARLIFIIQYNCVV
jgi:hypothetical protein